MCSVLPPSGTTKVVSWRAGSGYRELTEGEHAAFGIGQGQKGPQARDIVRG
ncbi:hypothetical protein SUDANB176_07278 [Streptomyces sp. enrichment culture]